MTTTATKKRAKKKEAPAAATPVTAQTTPAPEALNALLSRVWIAETPPSFDACTSDRWQVRKFKECRGESRQDHALDLEGLESFVPAPTPYGNAIRTQATAGLHCSVTRPEIIEEIKQQGLNILSKNAVLAFERAWYLIQKDRGNNFRETVKKQSQKGVVDFSSIIKGTEAGISLVRNDCSSALWDCRNFFIPVLRDSLRNGRLCGAIIKPHIMCRSEKYEAWLGAVVYNSLIYNLYNPGVSPEEKEFARAELATFAVKVIGVSVAYFHVGVDMSLLELSKKVPTAVARIMGYPSMSADTVSPFKLYAADLSASSTPETPTIFVKDSHFLDAETMWQIALWQASVNWDKALHSVAPPGLPTSKKTIETLTKVKVTAPPLRMSRAKNADGATIMTHIV
jgi:hypothetical protein